MYLLNMYGLNCNCRETDHKQCCYVYFNSPGWFCENFPHNLTGITDSQYTKQIPLDKDFVEINDVIVRKYLSFMALILQIVFNTLKSLHMEKKIQHCNNFAIDVFE